MNTIPLSFQTPIKQTVKTTEGSTAAAATSETVDFAALLTAVSKETAVTQAAADKQKEGLLGKLEQLHDSLQQLPQENLTPEQQEMMQMLMQLLTPQAPPEENVAQGMSTVQSSSVLNSQFQEAATAVTSPSVSNREAIINSTATGLATVETPATNTTATEETIIEEHATTQLRLSAPTLEKLASDPAAYEKLVNLLENAIQELKKITAPSLQENQEPSKVPGNAKNLDQTFGQLTAFVQQLETEPQETEAKETVKQVQQLEQVLKQVTGLTQEPVNLVRPTETKPVEIQSGALPAHDLSKHVSREPVLASQEMAQTVESNLSGGALATDTAKASQTPQRAEASVPQATVRLSNLVEELGDVLRGSFRLNGEGDSKQIKISIFPEHLGHMDIRLTSVDGKMIAQIFTSSLAAKEALDMQANILRNSLQQQGITVEKIEISQQSTGHSFGQQSAHPDQRFSQQQKQEANVRTRNGYQRVEEETAAIVRQQPNGGSVMKVDYTI